MRCIEGDRKREKYREREKKKETERKLEKKTKRKLEVKTKRKGDTYHLLGAQEQGLSIHVSSLVSGSLVNPSPQW